MNTIITETLAIAQKQFSFYGFTPEQIDALLHSAQKDISTALSTLQTLLAQESKDVVGINNAIHGLKGVLATMGNTDIADKLDEIHKENTHSEEATINIAQIKTLLRI